MLNLDEIIDELKKEEAKLHVELTKIDQALSILSPKQIPSDNVIEMKKSASTRKRMSDGQKARWKRWHRYQRASA